MLLHYTDEYHERLTLLFKTWVYGDVAKPPTFVLPLQSEEVHFNPSKPILANFTDPSTNETFEIIPSCIPVAEFEQDCYNGIDDDCNGKCLVKLSIASFTPCSHHAHLHHIHTMHRPHRSF